MQPILLIDIGSTYTKVTAIDLDEPALLGTASAHTTIQTDVTEGLNHALAILEAKIGSLAFTQRLACSSAAGGLRMVASGLAPSLTEEAARMACLGAGAKVIRSFAYKLTEEDVAEIADLQPDILLLVGGTDGGNEAVILHNAALIATLEPTFPIVLAGNRNAAKPCREILAHFELYVTENVMPRLETLNAEPVQHQIRELFLDRIIQAKGLRQVAEQMNLPLIPTPSAMLLAMELLSKGTADSPGMGELLAADLGGATTDVYSMARGAPTDVTTILRGIPEPYSKRTVEGDIGMRYSVSGIVDAVGIDEIAKQAGLSVETAEALIAQLINQPDTLPDTLDLAALDCALASAAVLTAVTRHAGTIETVYTPQGPVSVQMGKDLTSVSQLILTGGAIVHNPEASQIASSALFDAQLPTSLRPKQAKIYIDKSYILASMGLLSQNYPEAALSLMKKELTEHGTQEQASH